jgi:Tol biopolymer transport system component
LTVLAAVLVGGISVLAGFAGGAVDDTILVSRQSTADGGGGADDRSDGPSVSANGRYVAFASQADNLSAEDNNAFSNVFVRDTVAGTTTLVSRQSASAGGAAADGDSFGAQISADGNIVAFESTAGNLSTEDNDPNADVFIRNLSAGTTTLVSRQSASDGGAAQNTFAAPVSISASGRYVVFVSNATNLSTVAPNAFTKVFLRDVQSSVTELISRQSAADGGATADDHANSGTDSGRQHVSDDGRFVVFQSTADNLSTEDDNSVQNIFLRDRQAGTTTLVSRSTSGQAADGFSGNPALSGDGRYVSFESDADNLSTEDNNAVRNIFVRDMATGATTLVSRQSNLFGGAAANGTAFSPVISTDGRYIAFISDAGNLTSPPVTGRHTYVRDVTGGNTYLVSRQSGPAGAVENGSSHQVAISRDGHSVAWQSDADNLSTEDNDAVLNVYIRAYGTGVIGPTITIRCKHRIATLLGTPAGDILRGTPRRDVISGLGGHDTIRGLGGNDVICGGLGPDRLYGGVGRDTLLGGPGRDLLLGGPGVDKLVGGPGKDHQKP